MMLSGFTAYNEIVGGPETHANTTTYADNGDNIAGWLKDIDSGEYTPVLLSTDEQGARFDSWGTIPAAGTDADEIFTGFVDFSGFNTSARMVVGQYYNYEFTNLEVGAYYEFAGTAIAGRDESSFSNCWTLVSLLGVDSFTAEHSEGAGVVTHDFPDSGLEPNQVALLTGTNHLAGQGFVVQWTEINAGDDGAFEVVSTQYTGPTPTGINASGVANGDCAYAPNAVRLIQADPTAPATVINTPATNVGTTEARIGGEVTSTGGQQPNITIYYGDEDGGINPESWAHSINLGPHNSTFSGVVSDLDFGTEHFFRARAENAIGPTWAPSSESFTTIPIILASVENQPAINISTDSARLRGEITDVGNDPPEVTIYYGPSDGGTDTTAWDESIELGVQTGPFSWPISGLNHTTTYYFRAMAKNRAEGQGWAPTTAHFDTFPITVASLECLPPTSIGPQSARLNGQILYAGNDMPVVTIHFGDEDGGNDPNAWDTSFDMGLQDGPFTMTANDLTPETRYYYTASAENIMGVSWAPMSFWFETPAPAPLQITEFMAGNDDTLWTSIRADAGTDFPDDNMTPDWIEIFNPTGAGTNLYGYHLRDENDQWTFPPDTWIDADGYLIVFASGENITDPALDKLGYLHTDFSLSKGGEYLGLLEPGGGVVHQYTPKYPTQTDDVSYGIGSDDAERFFLEPTPGLANINNEDIEPHAPQFLTTSQMFTGSIDVELAAADPSDTIHYTLDESIPTAASPVYTVALTLSNTTMVRAVSVGSNGKVSQVAGESFIELDADVLDFTSDLPIVVIDMFGDSVPGKGSFGDNFLAIFETQADGRSSLTNGLDMGSRAGIHIRGSSSAGFPKKNYRLEFWNENDSDRDLSPLGLAEESDWILYGPNRYDRALINNPLMYDLSNQIDRYATRSVWVEVFLNTNGGEVSQSDYVGIYAFMEEIKKGPDRVDVEELTSGAGGLPVEGGFIWKFDRDSPYVYPRPEEMTSQQQSYIDGYFNSFLAAVTGPNFTDPDLGYAAWIDVDSFIDHNILNTLAVNVDALRLSTYYFKTADGKLEAGPIWDFDRALEATDGRDDNPQGWYYFLNTNGGGGWWDNLGLDPDYVQKYIDRWFELRETVFDLENGLYATIDAQAAQIAEAAPRDYARWDDSRYVDFAGEIQHMKDWLTDRVNWIDSQWLAKPTTDVAQPVVTPGTEVTLSSSVGTVYYTLDGSDPRGFGGAIGGIAGGGPIVIDDYTKITARVYLANHGPTSQPYIPSGDDWSAPAVIEYFINPLPGPGDLILTEINYHPLDPTISELATLPPAAPAFENNDFEFIELENVSGHTVNICGVELSGGIDFEFENYLMDDGDRIVVVEDLEGFIARYGAGGSLDGTGITAFSAWSGELNNGGEQVAVVARDGTAIVDFSYNDGGNWPGRADGGGSSLEVVDGFDGDYTSPENWRSSSEYGGTPGTAGVGPIDEVVVNEVLSHTDPPFSDAIELYNLSGADVLLDGWFLSDTSNNHFKYEISGTTWIDAGGYRVFDESHFNSSGGTVPNDFALNGAHGEDVWLMKVDGQGKVFFADHVEFGAAANPEDGLGGHDPESFGRWPNGTGKLYPMTERTFDDANSGPRVGPLVISEVHYNSGEPDEIDDLEFVEIYNPTDDPVELTNWRIRKGIDYEFDSGTALGSHKVLVVLSFDPNKMENGDRVTAFRVAHDIWEDDSVVLVGGYGGQLENAGEQVQLQRPDEPLPDEQFFIPHLLEDEVEYDDQSPWPMSPNGNGDSLHRREATLWGNDAGSWTAATPTPGSVEWEFGATVVGDLASIPASEDPVHMVDIFRRSDEAGRVVDEALDVLLDRGLHTIWMQIGVINEAAAKRARAKGVDVLMDVCPKMEYQRLSGELSRAGINSGVITARHGFSSLQLP